MHLVGKRVHANRQSVDLSAAGLRYPPTENRELLMKAKALYEKQDIKGAADALSLLVDDFPDFTHGHFSMGLMSLMLNDLPRSIRCWALLPAPLAA